MRHVWLALAFVAASATAQYLEEEGIENNLESIDDKAAPWWEQQDEAAKRRCQSSCTMHSKGVKNPQITLCDDTDVSFKSFLKKKSGCTKTRNSRMLTILVFYFRSALSIVRLSMSMQAPNAKLGPSS